MKPVLFVTNHAPAFRIGAFAALHEAEDVVFALVGGGVRHGGAIVDARPAVPRHPPQPARRRTARRVGPLPRGRGRPVGPRRAPRRLPRRAQSRHPVRPLGDDLAPPAHAGACALLPAAAPPLPPRGRDRHVRTARVRLRPLQGRYATGVRGAPERRRRVLDGARATAPPRAVPGPLRGPARAREGSRNPAARLAARRPRPGRRRPARHRRRDPHRRADARANCATCTPARTSWSYRRSPRATSWSRGGWW